MTTPTTTDLWGQDIALDASSTGLGTARVSASGELILTDGVQTGVQDIRLRLLTRLGALFYDRDFGALLHDWIRDEDTPEARMALEAELIARTETDPRVKVGSVGAHVAAWDQQGLSVQITWEFIGEDQPLNLVLQLNKSTSVRELVLTDAAPARPAVNPRL